MSSIIIPARYASTRFPGKVLAPVGGIPMIVRVTNRCVESKADNVYVVCDDERVKNALKSTGVDVIMSAPSLPTGTDRVAFAAQNINDDIILNVQGDEPFIPPSLMNGLIDMLNDEPQINMGSACVRFQPDEDFTNPAHVKVVLDNNCNALYFSRHPIPFDRDGIIPARYKHIGVYAFRRKYLMSYASLPKTPLESAEMLEQLRALEHGEKIKMLITNYHPLSVDTPEDLAAAEAFLRANGEYYEK